MEFSIHEELWFSTPIWESEVKNIDNNEIKDYCLWLRDNTKGAFISNRGGWHSSEIVLPLPNQLMTLFNNLELFVNLRCAELFNHNALLYAGAGVTKASSANKEWEETQRKLNTVKSLFKD